MGFEDRDYFREDALKRDGGVTPLKSTLIRSALPSALPDLPLVHLHPFVKFLGFVALGLFVYGLYKIFHR
jgi:hypothetical protein